MCDPVPVAEGPRPMLDEAALRTALVQPGALWTELRVVAATGSTNADLVAAARGGAAEGVVLLAEEQHAGRGRLGRRWVSPVGAAIMCSVLLRPGEPVPGRGWPAVPRARYAWLPMLAGVALVAVVRRAGVDAALKWPNDLLVGPEQRKCAGILVETVPVGDTPPAVVGMGVNVGQREDELPDGVPATSLALAGATTVDRATLVRELLSELADWYGRWRAAAGDPRACGLVAAYRRSCGTLGRRVTVHLPGGGRIVGAVVDIDTDGRLLVAQDEGAPTAVAAGDIVHLR